jgi:rhamnosyl/mannosyltransferase
MFTSFLSEDLSYYKGCDILIEAFRKIENAELIIVGNGDLEGTLKQQAKEYGIEDRVHFWEQSMMRS